MDTIRPCAKRLALLAVLLGPAAHANGAFPAVSQLVADPSDPAHLVLRSNFGLLTTRGSVCLRGRIRSGLSAWRVPRQRAELRATLAPASRARTARLRERQLGGRGMSRRLASDLRTAGYRLRGRRLFQAEH